MRTLLTLSLVAAVASAIETDTVRFKLPDAGGQIRGVQDFKSRYLLLVYQGIP